MLVMIGDYIVYCDDSYDDDDEKPDDHVQQLKVLFPLEPLPVHHTNPNARLQCKKQ